MTTIARLWAAMLLTLLPCVLPAQHPGKTPSHPSLTTVALPGDTILYQIVQDCRLYTERWDTLAQPNFWCTVMCMEKDSSIVNIAATRQILGGAITALIDSMEEEELEAYKDSVRKVHGLDEEEKVYVTSGKSDYYTFKEVLPSISKSVEVFINEGVDPWYAQAILLIESPGIVRTSGAGAHGHFQLMKRVAIEQGLKVNSIVDERNDLEKSAGGAARLLKNVCIPRTKMILRNWGLRYDEEAIWFRLLVLHVYHAGYRNVRGVVNKIRPQKGNMALIQKIWQTEYRNFGNSSQNYSQLVLASMIRLDQLITDSYEMKCDCCN